MQAHDTDQPSRDPDAQDKNRRRAGSRFAKRPLEWIQLRPLHDGKDRKPMPFSEAFAAVDAVVQELRDLGFSDKELAKLVEDINEGRIPIAQVDGELLVFRQSARLAVAEAVYDEPPAPAPAAQKAKPAETGGLSEIQKRHKSVRYLQSTDKIDVGADGVVQVNFEHFAGIGDDIRKHIESLDDAFEFKATLKDCVTCYDRFFRNHPEYSKRFLEFAQTLSPPGRKWLFKTYSKLRFAMPDDLRDDRARDRRDIYLSANASNLAHLLANILSRTSENDPFWQSIVYIVNEYAMESDGFDMGKFMEKLANMIHRLPAVFGSKLAGLLRRDTVL